MHRSDLAKNFALALSALFIAMAAWAVSSPMGSSPDDGFHLTSIMCGPLRTENTCEQADSSPVLVPAAAIWSPCYAFDATVSGSCQVPRYTTEATALIDTTAVNKGFYPPGFYAFHSAFASTDAYFTSYVVRLANIIIYVSMVALALLVAPPRNRRVLLVAQALVLTPLAISIVPSTNPSSWAYTSVSLFGFVLISHFSPENTRRSISTALLLLTVIIGALSRSDSVVWMVLIFMVIVVLKPHHRKLNKFDALTGALACCIGAYAFMSSRQDEMARGGLEAVREVGSIGSTSQIDLDFHNLGEVVRLALGAVGPSPLGWLDTPMVSFVQIAGPIVILSAIFVRLGKADRRSNLAITLSIGFLFLTPMYLLRQGNYLVGEAIQARYFMPFLAAVMVVLLLPLRKYVFTVSKSQAFAFVLILSISHTFALHSQIRRYVTGTDVRGFNLNNGAEWWFTSGSLLSPMSVWALGSAAFVVFLSLAFRELFDHQLLTTTQTVAVLP
jgi:hypothetical protein